MNSLKAINVTSPILTLSISCLLFSIVTNTNAFSPTTSSLKFRNENLPHHHHHHHHVNVNLQQQPFYASSTSSTSLHAKTQPYSWSSIESKLNPALSTRPPTTIDPNIDPTKPNFSSTKPTLFRERHGWCPYSERVFLALEVKGIDYDTVYVDNTGHGKRPNYFSGQTPQMRWEDGSMQGESMDLVRAIDAQYTNANEVELYPKDIQNEVINKIRAFDSIFPRRTRPSSRAAFLFRYDGEPLWKNEFEKVLRETNELLGETATNGPFFCGERFTAADVAWVPFLERYAAQLPSLHDDLNPRYDERSYPHLVAWYDAMDNIPTYACRVKGDASSWRKVLSMAGYGNGGVPMDVSNRMLDMKLLESKPLSEKEIEVTQQVWDMYSNSRPWMAKTSAAEAASVMTRNREAIRIDLEKRRARNEELVSWTEEQIDETMRAMVCLLCQDLEDFVEEGMDGVMEEYTEDIGVLATYLDDRMCVPRDMGCLSAATIKRLIPKLVPTN